jgi:pyrimidine-nucleoside phosphorylase
MSFLPSELIKKKRNKNALEPIEIEGFIRGYTEGNIPDYQMSAMLMAIFFNGMTEEETLALTKAMLNSGEVIKHSNVKSFKVDKHSTGGVGDKTSLILGPVVASLGVAVPMISGRGLGHTGGTLDKLESIPGFNTQIDLDGFRKMIEEIGISFIGQTREICPADKKIYALRDVTATVESLPLICASIMSKKLAEGIDGLVLDVKFGTGAFMKTSNDAEKLALALMKIGQGYGKKVCSLITNMNQPLGRFAGNSLEVVECVEIMEGKSFIGANGKDLYEDTRELSLALSGYMLWLAGYKNSIDDCISAARATLYDGRALAKWHELVRAHGGRMSELPVSLNKFEISSLQSGYISGFDTENIGICGIAIKAGRAKTDDQIEPTAGIEFHRKIGDFVKTGESLFTIYGADLSLLNGIKEQLVRAVVFCKDPVRSDNLIHKVITQ